MNELGWKDPQFDLVWPSPPDKAKIELLRVVGSKEISNRDNSGRRLLDWLTGGSPETHPLINPYGIASDSRGLVWVADPGSSLVHRFDIANRNVDYIGQAGGLPLVSPVDVVYDAQRDELFVSDSGLKKVFVLSGQGDHIRTLDTPDGFERPAGMALDGHGQLFVVDVLKGVVEIFDRQGQHRRSVGSAASADRRFSYPSNVFVDADGRLYVVDSMRFRVEVQGPDGELAQLIGRQGDSAGSFARPRGVAVDSFGHIYVSDAAFDNIQIFNQEGQLLLYLGRPGRGPGEFCLPAGLHIDANDRIYVTESCNYRFQVMQYLGEE